MSGAEMNELQRSFGRMEGKLDSLSEIVKEAVSTHDRRLSKLEKRQHWMSGAGAAIGSMVTLAVTAVFGRH